MKEVGRQPIKKLKRVAGSERKKIHEKALMAACVKKGGKWIAGKCSPKSA